MPKLPLRPRLHVQTDELSTRNLWDSDDTTDPRIGCSRSHHFGNDSVLLGRRPIRAPVCARDATRRYSTRRRCPPAIAAYRRSGTLWAAARGSWPSLLRPHSARATDSHKTPARVAATGHSGHQQQQDGLKPNPVEAPSAALRQSMYLAAFGREGQTWNRRSMARVVAAQPKQRLDECPTGMTRNAILCHGIAAVAHGAQPLRANS
jgi:hypothetical protein